MTNEYKILDILMILFSTQIINTYLNAFHNKKEKSPNIFKWLIWSIYIIFQYWVMESSASFPLLILVLNIIIIFIIQKTTYYINNKTAIFLSGIFYAIWMLVEVAINNLLSLTNIDNESYFFVVGSIFSKISMYIIVHILKKYKKATTFSDVPTYYWFELLLIPIGTVYIIHNTYCLTFQNTSNTFFTITTILMLLTNYITFDVYDKLGNLTETEKKNIAYEQQIYLCNKQASERESAYQDTRRLRHDLNGYLLDLKTALQAKQFKEAEQKIDYILEKNQIYKNEISHSGNIVIDSLINYKFSFARKEDIDLKCYISIPEQINYESADLCVILSNLIDNAIEAVHKIPVENRHISISITLVKGILTIIVKNPHDGFIKKNTFGKILSNKTDSKNHGIGLESVQRTVDKYNGELAIEHENKLFKVTVILYPMENLQTES